MALAILPAARADLIEIGDFIASDNPVRARSFVAEIEAVIVRQVAVRPASFPARPDLAPNLRVARHGRYLIYFTHAGDTVAVVRVLHGARDSARLFDRT
ncbi:type II toxin-antitoxin system RelE/ParE family toxin [Methylobacterium sp. NEAU 140]|uniref:type II toxin-antitoxin system RelE/ParE family toxin n=1 Tax=Methylobacterium sp. NEAU 140 TaxID=3064945 RepID=UPI002733AFB2|nr:type II toxin-antitoxin system RelE/ParE family toxin [Methylobacterium sp. NEAU 140]MDP4022361.1 type II toxin-antitoxin system RelE/ParE family toxin [Methylobacterium sp. NEAU 140]